ncbi:MAG: hypothetical protein Q9226_002665 [Calogaya cf. arnoldii]
MEDDEAEDVEETMKYYSTVNVKIMLMNLWQLLLNKTRIVKKRIVLAPKLSAKSGFSEIDESIDKKRSEAQDKSKVIICPLLHLYQSLPPARPPGEREDDHLGGKYRAVPTETATEANSGDEDDVERIIEAAKEKVHQAPGKIGGRNQSNKKKRLQRISIERASDH